MSLEVIEELYSEFNRLYFKLPETYKYKLSEAGKKTVKKFLDNPISKFKGLNFLHKYLTFQFNHYSYTIQTEEQGFYGKVTINLIFSSKSIKRWIDRDQDFDYHLNNSLVKKHFLERFQKEVEPNLSYENAKRKQFINTDFGLIYCIENTSGYNQKLLACVVFCKNKDACKQILEKL